MSNIIGYRKGNTIIPYQAATKRTKFLDLSSKISLNLGATSISNIVANGYAYADSDGQWWLACTGSVDVDSASQNYIELLFDGVSFPSGTNAAQNIDGGDSYQATKVCYIALAVAGGNIMRFFFDGLVLGLGWNMNIKLASKPDWADANMDGVVSADIWISPASAGIAGLVDNTAGNTGGTPIKGSINGSAPAISDIGYEIVEHCTVATVTTVADTEIDVTGCYIIVPEGVWDLSYYAVAGAYRASGNAPVWMRCRITDDSYNLETSTESLLGFENATSGLFGNYGIMTMSKRIYLTEEKTFKLRVTCNQSTANGAGYVYSTGSSIGGISGNDSTTYLRAVRAL